MSGASVYDRLRMYSLLSHIASINRATVTRPAPSQQMLRDNKKTRAAFQSRVNPVSWITNPNSHTPVSNSIAYFIRGYLVILSKLYDRPQEFLYQYVTSKKSKVFHKITCEHVATIKEENIIFFQSLKEAQKSERRGCKNCKPEE
jgi:hypothetical protein